MHSPYRSRQQSLCTCCKANIGILPRVGLGTEPYNQASLAVYRSLDIVNIHGSSRSSAPSSFVQSAARQSLPENSKPAASLSRRYVTETLSFLPRCHFPFVPSATSKQGSLVIFFTNFLALIIQAELADAESNGSAVYSVVLVMVHMLFILSIGWNSWVSTKAMFSGSDAKEKSLSERKHGLQAVCSRKAFDPFLARGSTFPLFGF